MEVGTQRGQRQRRHRVSVTRAEAANIQWPAHSYHFLGPSFGSRPPNGEAALACRQPSRASHKHLNVLSSDWKLLAVCATAFERDNDHDSLCRRLAGPHAPMPCSGCRLSAFMRALRPAGPFCSSRRRRRRLHCRRPLRSQTGQPPPQTGQPPPPVPRSSCDGRPGPPAQRPAEGGQGAGAWGHAHRGRRPRAAGPRLQCLCARAFHTGRQRRGCCVCMCVCGRPAVVGVATPTRAVAAASTCTPVTPTGCCLLFPQANAISEREKRSTISPEHVVGQVAHAYRPRLGRCGGVCKGCVRLQGAWLGARSVRYHHGVAPRCAVLTMQVLPRRWCRSTRLRSSSSGSSTWRRCGQVSWPRQAGSSVVESWS